MNLETILFENNTLRIINQTELPELLNYIELTNLDETINSIKNLQVRGAPAIGIVAAYGFYIHAKNLNKVGKLTKSNLLEAVNLLKRSRPTAVNLQWAIDKMIDVFQENQKLPISDILNSLKISAQMIHAEDKNACALIGKFGSKFISDSVSILTHCNAGILATGGIGTALAPVYTAHQAGKKIHVFVDETRPVGQGARLTYWELNQNQVPATLITDNMAASIMQSNKIDLVIVGADRIASNGDVANKIGTYGLAVLADYHKIPFYVAAPTSTIDLDIESGSSIPIEERQSDEITAFWNIMSSENYNVYNPAFDVTPNHLISAIITEKGVIHRPVKENLKNYN
jgi:methylthioribose-1-phosphate isomerase